VLHPGYGWQRAATVSPANLVLRADAGRRAVSNAVAPLNVVKSESAWHAWRSAWIKDLHGVCLEGGVFIGSLGSTLGDRQLARLVEHNKGARVEWRLLKNNIHINHHCNV
jgi:hypothetical protein